MAGANNENYWTAVIAADPATIISRVQLSLYDGETEERMMVKYDRKIASLLNLNGDAAEKTAARDLAGEMMQAKQELARQHGKCGTAEFREHVIKALIKYDVQADHNVSPPRGRRQMALGASLREPDAHRCCPARSTSASRPCASTRA